MQYIFKIHLKPICSNLTRCIFPNLPKRKIKLYFNMINKITDSSTKYFKLIIDQVSQDKYPYIIYRSIQQFIEWIHLHCFKYLSSKFYLQWDTGYTSFWFFNHILYIHGFPSVTVVKNLPANAGDTRDSGSISGWGKIPWNKKWQPTPVLLPGEFHGQRSLVGYSPWGYRIRHNWATEHTHTPTLIYNPYSQIKMNIYIYGLHHTTYILILFSFLLIQCYLTLSINLSQSLCS